jgi:acyl carrier protein
MTTTFDGLRDIIVRDFELPAERLRRETPLEEIELDSLAVTELVFALEDEFHVTAGNVNPAFKNLGDIADYIDGLIAERDAAPKAKASAPKTARRARAKPANGANGGRPHAAGDAPPRKRKRSSAATNGARPR